MALVAGDWHIGLPGQPSLTPPRPQLSRVAWGTSSQACPPPRLTLDSLGHRLSHSELPFISHQRQMLCFQTPLSAFCLLCVYLFIYCLC